MIAKKQTVETLFNKANSRDRKLILDWLIAEATEYKDRKKLDKARSLLEIATRLANRVNDVHRFRRSTKLKLEMEGPPGITQNLRKKKQRRPILKKRI